MWQGLKKTKYCGADTLFCDLIFLLKTRTAYLQGRCEDAKPSVTKKPKG